MLKAIIVEDEESSRITLENMITNFCEGVEIIGIADSVSKAVKLIKEHMPDFLFLDIELPEEQGFKIFEYFPSPSFEVVFTTAYDEYALSALKLSAVDYLLKPIDIEELRSAINKVRERKRTKTHLYSLEILRGNLNNKFKKIALPTNEGLSFIDMDNIIRCEAQGNYTMFYLKENERIMVSKTLKSFTELLEPLDFFRISRSQLINLIHIKKFGRQKAPSVTMIDGVILSVSLIRKEELIKKLENLMHL